MISDVIKVCEDIKQVFNSENLRNSIFSYNEELKVIEIIENRFGIPLITDYHYLAFYLDPRYREIKIIESKEELITKVYNALHTL